MRDRTGAGSRHAPDDQPGRAGGDIDLMEDLPTASIAEFKANSTGTVVAAPSARSIYIALDKDRDDSPGLSGTDGTITR